MDRDASVTLRPVPRSFRRTRGRPSGRSHGRGRAHRCGRCAGAGRRRPRGLDPIALAHGPVAAASFAGAVTAGAAVSMRPDLWRAWGLAAIAALLALGGTPAHWDSFRLLFAVLTAVAAAGAAVAAATPQWRLPSGHGRPPVPLQRHLPGHHLARRDQSVANRSDVHTGVQPVSAVHLLAKCVPLLFARARASVAGRASLEDREWADGTESRSTSTSGWCSRCGPRTSATRSGSATSAGCR